MEGSFGVIGSGVAAASGDDGEYYGKFGISQLDEGEGERTKDISDGPPRPDVTAWSAPS